MTNLPAHVEKSIHTRGLLRPGARVLVAVSGGLDSVVLLHLLGELAARHDWKLAVAHLNHRLRGRSSHADERFVRALAASLGLPSFVERAGVRGTARRQKLSVEMAARRLRHAFLARCARRFRAETVALAHHADDQVELFFLRLLRGAGGEGLQGMKWRSPSPVRARACGARQNEKDLGHASKAAIRIHLVRPLLDVPRDALQEYAARHKLTFREDASNASLDILRNRIRHRLLPLLRREFQPGIARTVTRLMDTVGADAACVGETAAAWLRRKRRPAFETLSLAIQRAVLRQQLLDCGVVPDFELIECLTSTADRRVSIGPNRCAWRGPGGKVHVEEQAPLCFTPGCQVIELKGRAGEIEFAGRRFNWRIVRARGAALPSAVRGCEWFDADAIGPVVRLRHWRPGDRFQPSGLPRPAKLQDLFTNACIPSAWRRALVVAEAADGRLFWVEGLRISEPFKLCTSTKRRLFWRWRQSNRSRIDQTSGRLLSDWP